MPKAAVNAALPPRPPIFDDLSNAKVELVLALIDGTSTVAQGLTLHASMTARGMAFPLDYVIGAEMPGVRRVARRQHVIRRTGADGRRPDGSKLVPVQYL